MIDAIVEKKDKVQIGYLIYFGIGVTKASGRFKKIIVR